MVVSFFFSFFLRGGGGRGSVAVALHTIYLFVDAEDPALDVRVVVVRHVVHREHRPVLDTAAAVRPERRIRLAKRRHAQLESAISFRSLSVWCIHYFWTSTCVRFFSVENHTNQKNWDPGWIRTTRRVPEACFFLFAGSTDRVADWWVGQDDYGAAVVIVDGGPDVAQRGGQRPLGDDVLARSRVALKHRSSSIVINPPYPQTAPSRVTTRSLGTSSHRSGFLIPDSETETQVNGTMETVVGSSPNDVFQRPSVVAPLGHDPTWGSWPNIGFMVGHDPTWGSWWVMTPRGVHGPPARGERPDERDSTKKSSLTSTKTALM